MTEKQNDVQPDASPSTLSQDELIAQISEEITEKVTRDVTERVQASADERFRTFQAKKDRETAAANQRAKAADERFVASISDPSIKKDYRIQQLEAQVQQIERERAERVALGQSVQWFVDHGAPSEIFVEAATPQEVSDRGGEYFKELSAKGREPKKEVIPSTPASTVPSAAPEVSVLNAATKEKRMKELVLLSQNAKTKRERTRYQKEWMALSRSPLGGRRVSV